MTREMTAALPILAAALGAGSVTQVGINSALAKQLGHFLPAAVISYAGGIGFIAVANGILWRVQRFSPEARATAARAGRKRRGCPAWWEMCGGMIGSTALVGSIASAPYLSYTVIATINSVGQLLSSLCVDHFGFLGVSRRSPPRLHERQPHCHLLFAVTAATKISSYEALQ